MGCRRFTTTTKGRSSRVRSMWGGWKYEYLYLHDHTDGRQLERGLSEYLRFYNEERPHQALDYRTPQEVYGN